MQALTASLGYVEIVKEMSLGSFNTLYPKNNL